jgi:predicted dehydrogenase
MVVYDDVESDEKVKVYDRGVQCQPKDPNQLYQTLVQYRIGDMWAPNLDRTEALRKECDFFVQCVRDGRRPFNDGRSGLRVVRLLEAASASMRRGGRRVDVV